MSGSDYPTEIAPQQPVQVNQPTAPQPSNQQQQVQSNQQPAPQQPAQPQPNQPPAQPAQQSRALPREEKIFIKPNIVALFVNFMTVSYNVGCTVFFIILIIGVLTALSYAFSGEIWSPSLPSISGTIALVLVIAIPLAFYIWTKTYYLVVPGQVVVNKGFKAKAHQIYRVLNTDLQESIVGKIFGFGHITITYMSQLQKEDRVILSFVPHPQQNHYLERISNLVLATDINIGITPVDTD